MRGHTRHHRLFLKLVKKKPTTHLANKSVFVRRSAFEMQYFLTVENDLQYWYSRSK